MSTQKLVENFIGVSVSFRWLGTTRTVEEGPVDILANSLHVDRDFLILKKQIFDTSIEPYRNLSILRNRIRQYWIRQTLPSIDRGVRLILTDKVGEFVSKMESFREEWDSHVQGMDRIWDQILRDIQTKLGSLFNLNDYKGRPVELFRFRWDFAPVSFPEQLLRLGFRTEYERFQEKLNATLVAIKLSFLEELNSLVEHLVERLTPDPVTKERKKFKDATVQNLHEFFQRFKELNITDDEQLASIIQAAENLLAGVDADQLRSNDVLAERIRESLKQVSDQVKNEQVITVERLRRLWI